MKTLSCACCGSRSVVRHARRNQVFWYCLSCRQEMIPLEVSVTQVHRSIRPQTAGIA